MYLLQKKRKTVERTTIDYGTTEPLKNYHPRLKILITG